MTAAELAEKLERLDALFVELYNYAESQSLSDTMSKSGANALRAIKGGIGNRYNVIPQAAARLRSMEEALNAVLAEEMIYTGAIHETLEASGMYAELTAKILAALERI